MRLSADGSNEDRDPYRRPKPVTAQRFLALGSVSLAPYHGRGAGAGCGGRGGGARRTWDHIRGVGLRITRRKVLFLGIITGSLG